MSFQENWNNLFSRKMEREAGTLNSERKAELQLTPNFQKWAKENWGEVQIQLANNGISGQKEPLSHADWANWRIQQTNPYFSQNELFPHSRQINDYLFVQSGGLQRLMTEIDQRIAEWNPRITLVDEIREQSDEFGNPIQDDDYEEPEVIGDIRDLDDPHFTGINEYGDSVYTDFDVDGFFQPMGNPTNSADTNDDLDMSDHTNYQAQGWESLDKLDDFNVDYNFSEVSITERPVFDKKDEVVWENESSPDESAPISTGDDADWVKDAHNWLTRERLLGEANSKDIKENILSAYPVSHDFINYLEKNEINFEVANQRLGQLTGLRETAVDDLKQFGAEVPTVEEPPIEYLEKSYLDSDMADIPFM